MLFRAIPPKGSAAKTESPRKVILPADMDPLNMMLRSVRKNLEAIKFEEEKGNTLARRAAGERENSLSPKY